MTKTAITKTVTTNTFERLVGRLIEAPESHARFVNTLSLLEYIGARKILKSQKEESITADVLSHAAEEIRHAQTFKKIALKMSEGQLTSYSDAHLLCGVEARLYFQTVDKSIAQEFGLSDPWNNYLYTTLLVEERANQIYPFYDDVLTRLGFPAAIKAILREEAQHLHEILTFMETSPFYKPERMVRLREIEAVAFERYMKHSIEFVEKAHAGAGVS